MKPHLQNAAYGVLDYAAYPLGMIALAPVLLHALGATQFGIWAFSTAVINSGAILASGFGDANIRQIALARGTGNTASVEQCIRTTLSIHLLLGVLLAIASYTGAPLMARHVATSRADVATCVASLHIASLCILFRAVETVLVSTQRAFERYRESVRISVVVTLLSLAAASGLALFGYGVQKILAASAVFVALGTVAQFLQLRQVVSGRWMVPGYDRPAGAPILQLGLFTWLQAAGMVVFGQVDRLFVGMAFGAAAVGAYSICIQLAQPITGVAASALHFMFPLLARNSAGPDPQLARRIGIAFAYNLLLVAAVSLALFAIGEHLLRSWTTPAVADAGAAILPFAIVGSAFAALAITGVYAMLALGRAAAVIGTTLTSGTAMLSSMFWLQRHYGLHGIAVSRVLFGAISLVIYVPLVRMLRAKVQAQRPAPAPNLTGAEEGA